ncbi:MAG: aspartate dehydrogenase [Lachnospiraceae bacterium]|nr:aspartate dehydrogenase [Lachnospiraceae bacterium]
MKLFGKKKPVHAYDPSVEKPVIRASICTGEQAAGFKDLKTGVFHEVMLIRDDKDLRTFLKTYGLDDVEKEY